MTAPDDVTLAFWNEQREQLRQSENQRSVLTNYVLTIAAAVSGFVIQQHFRVQTLPLSILVVLTGAYGALGAAKYHEPASCHLSQARGRTQVLVQSGGLGDTAGVFEGLRLDDYRRSPRLSRLRLHWLWTGLHLGMAVYGLVLVILTAQAGG